MPVIEHSSYEPPFYLANPHVQTVWHSEFRRVKGIHYQRFRQETDDGDFLDFDWLRNGGDKLAIVVHGLESSTTRPYMKGMVKALGNRGVDCLAMNLRGCGGEINRLKTFYHAGKTDDVETAVRYALQNGYRTLFLVGFSLGGNLVLRWLGERGRAVFPQVVAAAAVSAPCDLISSHLALNRTSNRIYTRRFVRKLLGKVKKKAEMMPDLLDRHLMKSVRTIEDFDTLFTAPGFGFEDAMDYYRRASALPLLHHICVPTLLLNALDDPFLGPACYPKEIAGKSRVFFLENPAHGGHVGFLGCNSGDEYWHEGRVSDFLLEEGLGHEPCGQA